jgi:hypothetical protein
MEVKLWFLKMKKSHKLGRQCHGSGSKLMTCYHEPMFDLRPVHVELGVEKLVLRHSSLWLLWFSPFSLIPPMLHIHISFICHQCQIISEFDSVLNKTKTNKGQ